MNASPARRPTPRPSRVVAVVVASFLAVLATTGAAWADGGDGERVQGLPVLDLVLAAAGVATVVALVVVRRRSARRDA